jgi:hypothetical protein
MKIKKISGLTFYVALVMGVVFGLLKAGYPWL